MYATYVDTFMTQKLVILKTALLLIHHLKSFRQTGPVHCVEWAKMSLAKNNKRM